MIGARDKLHKIISETTHSTGQATQLRDNVANSLTKQSRLIADRNFKQISNREIQLLLGLYDDLVFDGCCQQTLLESQDCISFRVSNRMTSAGGKTTIQMLQASTTRTPKRRSKNKLTPPRKFEIAISAILLFGTNFENYVVDQSQNGLQTEIDDDDTDAWVVSDSSANGSNELVPKSTTTQEDSRNLPAAKIETESNLILPGPISRGNAFSNSSDNLPNGLVNVAGLHCVDRLQALLLIFEHELVHLIEFLVWHDSSCSADRFRDISYRLFGHRQSSHQLITPREAAAIEKGIQVGDFVSFSHEGQQRMGFVNYIHRRATVLVPHRLGIRYADGNRYAKYYVPLNQLRRLK
ncbi:MAG TPA: hypothetical protein PKD64_13155 [Pirellulaceae bacterium]|nr:hypothetical protein [Pirellulaceae bacterium]HMO93134.1 hypothetical protein [Pirellulaceae bacterium]HMP70307.1 hypothetical protein [Pirellulaceae bacterium]